MKKFYYRGFGKLLVHNSRKLKMRFRRRFQYWSHSHFPF